MSGALALLSGLLIAAGVMFFIAGTLGLLRFPDPLSRLHALAKADNLGLGLIVLGLLPLMGNVFDALKLLLIWLLVLFGGATATQMLAARLRREGEGQ
jgi:multicomponent Na+:H+ antiporter subunit G